MNHKRNPIRKYLIMGPFVFLSLGLFMPAALTVDPCDSGEPSPEILKLLEKIERRCDSLNSFQGEMTFQLTQLLLDEARLHMGTIYYQVKEDIVHFRIHFDSRKEWEIGEPIPGKALKHDEDYAFDGLWFTNRNGRTKTLRKWQIAKTPQKKEHFRLGRSHFPLPFAVTKDDLVQNFRIRLIEAKPKDPANCDHLALIPLEKSPFAKEYKNLHLWINRKTTLPVRFQYEDLSAEITTCNWTKIKINTPIPSRKFGLTTPGADWNVEEFPLKESPESGDKK